MQMLYNSDHFVVVAFDLTAGTQLTIGNDAAEAAAPAGAEAEASPPVVEQAKVPAAPRLGGYEIVDKQARKEIFIQGAVAASFQQGVQALVEAGPDAEALDAYIGSFTTLAQHPVVVH
ncbi:DUF3567 domain-containing protein [Ideonella sp. DXS22W]|uniref:DUF3567 domain-containing protein n=1 Tax=Pseudaquabacterium inlustre TaxID=2984192 RepID=A0ABU9CR21_9BURK